MARQSLARRFKKAAPASLRSTPAWRAARAGYGAWNDLPHQFANARARFARASRLLALAARLPLQRRFLRLRCNETPEGSGLFSELAMVLAALDHYERWAPHYAGLCVDFGTAGLYYEPDAGPNWWTYYFEPIELGSAKGAVEHATSLLEHDLFEYDGGFLPRPRACDLLARYVRPRSALGEAVDAFVRERFGGDPVVGIHYRGTDHAASDPRVSWERVRAAAEDAAVRAGGRTARFFVATDEQAFLDDMLARYPGRVVCRDIFRSADGRPIDVFNRDGNRRKGEDAVMDCLLLSRCAFLVRTESHLSASALLFNPDLPDVLLA